MNEENQISYYSVIPATVRYDTNLKASEKLLYGEITSLTNKKGFCYAKNKYFANLYECDPHTVSRWISHLEKLGYIQIELIRDKRNEIKERRIYIRDNPYVPKNTYPYVLKSTYPMYQKVQENNININKDDLFYYTVNCREKISIEFYEVLNKLEFIYTENILSYMQTDKIEMLKDIIYVLYDISNGDFSYILSIVSRDALINLYTISKEHSPSDFLNYYKRSIINKYTNNST